MERAIKDLCQLGDTGFFKEVATGISHVVANVERLDLAGHETRKPVSRQRAAVNDVERLKVFVSDDEGDQHQNLAR